MKTKLFLSLLTVLLIFSAVAVSSAQSSPASGTGTYLQTVQIGNISNPNSGASNTSYSGYSIWTNITFQGTEGGAAPVHITYASAGATVQSTSIYSSAQIWIDYNDNGSFEAAEFCPFTLHTNLHQYNLNAHGTFADSFSDFISFPQGSAGTHLLRIRYLDQTISFDPDQDYTDN